MRKILQEKLRTLNSEIIKPFYIGELCSAINSAKTKSARGSNCISNEVLKKLPDDSVKFF